MLGDGHCFRDQVVNLCEMRGTQHKNLPFDFESNSLETLMKIVDREGGFTLIPELATLYMTEEKKKQVRSFTVSKTFAGGQCDIFPSFHETEVD